MYGKATRDFKFLEGFCLAHYLLSRPKPSVPSENMVSYAVAHEKYYKYYLQHELCPGEGVEVVAATVREGNLSKFGLNLHEWYLAVKATLFQDQQSQNQPLHRAQMSKSFRWPSMKIFQDCQCVRRTETQVSHMMSL